MNEINRYDTNKVALPEYKNLEVQFQNALDVVDDIVLKNYITKLSNLDVIPLSDEELSNNISENVRFFKINEMVYEKDEHSTHKFASVFNSVVGMECTVFVIIDSNGEKTDFYMGIRSSNSKRTTNSLKDILKNSIKGQFPGIKTQDYFDEDMQNVLDGIKATSISAVSTIANKKIDNYSDNKAFIQGLEKLALAMEGEKYTGIIVANGTNREQLIEIRKNYEKLYTQLSPFASSQISYANNSSVNLAKTFSKGLTTGTSYTEGDSDTFGSSEAQSTSTSNSVSQENTGSKVTKGLASTIGIVGAALTPVLGVGSLAVGGVATGVLGLVGATIQKTETSGDTKGVSFTKSSSSTKTESFGRTESINEGTASTEGLTTGTSQTIGITLQDKSIINILDKIDIQLDRLKEFESLGMWECATYFLADRIDIGERAALTYKALMCGENSGVEVSAINSWNKFDGNKINLITEYVKNFMHPIFSYDTLAGSIELTPSTLVSGNELALHMGLPRKSISGFPVIEHVDFGKEVVSYNNEKLTHTINLGNIFNMGNECVNRVKLNRNSLAMHTFITGSTGSGKSNTVYELLEQLNTVNINFLIIEPTKGEYKNIFGNRKDVVVMGTNQAYSEILRINPFKFPKDIHVLEHIDRLVEIFNVCWSMYAAMPAVLKDAILQAYESCGWDLVESTNKYLNNFFPTFKDLQSELINVIEDSAYSQELKSNYIGALVTRVKSLTNGLNGEIFSSDEVDNNILFDKNVIVDLSRVGSLETKSLIMGILVMRLNEHRMAYTKGMNLPLKHVTVLEEAHNILKRTSGEQGQEGANILGKSVEMLSNAIAEMRTYGEGFIIVDQSPSTVDLSAIRNTNTKIIMRLPDETDRKLVGKAAALKDEQLDEIAKLPKGVAVVYQNDWLEPVLCKVKKYHGKEISYEYNNSLRKEQSNKKIFISELLKLLLKKRNIEETKVDLQVIDEFLGNVDISTKNKLEIYFLLKEYKLTGSLKIWSDTNFDNLSELVVDILGCKMAVTNVIQRVDNFNLLTNELSNMIKKHTFKLNNKTILSICQCFLKEYSKENTDKLEIYAAWREEFKNGGIFI